MGVAIGPSMSCRRIRSTILFVTLAGCSSAPSAGEDVDANQLAHGEKPAASEVRCDALIVGGGLGGIAAAEELGGRGVSVCLTEQTQLLGGVYTAQGTVIDSLFREMSASFYGLENDVLDHYASLHPGEPRTVNPGDCRRFRSCWEPAVGASTIEHTILPRYPTVHVYKQHRPIAAMVTGGRLASVTFERADHTTVVMRAGITIDATDLGDLYPLANVPFRVGRDPKSTFNEPSALDDAGDPDCVQRMTWVFALERTQDDDANLIPMPPGYSAAKYRQPHDPEVPKYDIDRVTAPGKTWWDWRRYLAPDRIDSSGNHVGVRGAPDIASVNYFHESDFAVDRSFCGPLGCNAITANHANQTAIFADAKNHALGFLYYLQRDVWRPDGVRGYRNLRLRPDVMGTNDGMAAYPYIREGRRLRAVHTVTQNDFVGLGLSQPHFADSIGINKYQTDIHGCPRSTLTPEGEVEGLPPDPSFGALDMQIPFGALVPETMNGLLAGNSRNMGVSHIANGSLRIHPAEWNVGRAAGVAAGIVLEHDVEPRQVLASERWLRLLQQRLLTSPGSGPVMWAHDVLTDDRGWTALQMVGVAGVMGGYADDTDHPDTNLTRAQSALIVMRELGLTPVTTCPTPPARPTFSDVPCDYFAYGAIQVLHDRGIISGYSDGTFHPGAEVTRAQLAKIVATGDCSVDSSLCFDPRHPPANPNYADVGTSDWFYASVAIDKAHGYFRGTDADGHVFVPAASVTRREAAIWFYDHLRLRLGLE